MPVTFLLCDDHALFREGLVLLIERQPGWQVVAQAGDGNEAVRLTQELKPDLAVLDIAMPEGGGIEAANAIQAACPDTVIIALSMYGEEHYRQMMFRAGASAYVLKNQAGAELVEAIRSVLAGETYISPMFHKSRAEQQRRSTDRDLTRLTVREREVLVLLAKGLRTRAIAEMLNVSSKTVETYRSRIMYKCGIDNLVDLVKLAIRAGLVSTD
jgi:DNA-binding NarL/FixJ family response regulator